MDVDPVCQLTTMSTKMFTLHLCIDALIPHELLYPISAILIHVRVLRLPLSSICKYLITPDNKVALSLLLVHAPIRAHIRRDNSQKVVDSFGRNFFRLDSLRETGKRPHEVHISDLHVRPYHLTYIRATKF